MKYSKTKLTAAKYTFPKQEACTVAQNLYLQQLRLSFAIFKFHTVTRETPFQHMNVGHQNLLRHSVKYYPQ